MCLMLLFINSFLYLQYIIYLFTFYVLLVNFDLNRKFNKCKILLEFPVKLMIFYSIPSVFFISRCVVIMSYGISVR